MSEFQVIQVTLEKTARRRRWERAWRGFWRGLLVGAVTWLVVLVLFKLLPLPYWVLAVAGLAAVGSMVTGFIIGGWRKSPPQETARWIDAKQQLKERLSTALEVTSAPERGDWKQLLVHDAVRHAQGLDPRRLIPLHLPRSTRWALVVLALAAGLGFVPEYRSKEYLQKQNEVANVQNVGRQLTDLTKRILEQQPPALEPTEKAMTAVAEAGERLEKASLTRSDALRELANAAEKLSQQAEQLARNPAMQPLQRAARDPSGSAGNKSAEALQRQIESLKKSLGNDKATPEALDKLKAGVQQARNSAANMPDPNSAAGQALRQQLAQSLAALAQEARDMGNPLEALESALAALEKGQIDQVIQNLDVATEDLDKLTEMAKNLAQLQQQAARIGKDLPEQLANGQADAARQTLEKMINQLQSPGLSNEQLEKILDEVSRAIDPAGQYGKVAEHLKNAARQMQQARQSGDPSGECKSNAGQSLADAAKELEKLGQQMSDMQSLAATMEALDRAQQAIASGQGWGQCYKQGGQCSACNGRGCAACKGTGWKHGGGLSPAGVGTWANENEGWTYYDDIPQTPVDNSGVQRPDMDSRGITDRGPGDPSDALRPTKVKGKISPGGPMPSITLQGVSITGQSRVQYEESGTAAQSEGQSALSQDQIPRAYQNAVKDYFDDYKQ